MKAIELIKKRIAISQAIMREALAHFNNVMKELDETNKILQADNKQLKGELPIPAAWWADCPGLAQKTMERVIDRNDQQAEEIERLTEEIERLKSYCGVPLFNDKQAEEIGQLKRKLENK